MAELARASDKRAQVIALAMVLGAAEHGARDVHVWQAAEDNYRFHYGVPLAARHLAWLAEHTEYSLSDIEVEVAAYATGRAPGPMTTARDRPRRPPKPAKPPMGVPARPSLRAGTKWGRACTR